MKTALLVLCALVLSFPVSTLGQVAPVSPSYIPVVDSHGKIVGSYQSNNPFDSGSGYVLFNLGDGRITGINILSTGFRQTGVVLYYASANCSGTGYLSSSYDPWGVPTAVGDGKRGASGVLYLPTAQQPVTAVLNSYGFPGSCSTMSPQTSSSIVPFTTINIGRIFTPPFYLVTLPAPTFSPVPSTSYKVDPQVSLRVPTTGATIYYTTDGSAPTTSSAKYTGPIAISGNTYIRAMAVSGAYTQSPIAGGSYGVHTGGVQFNPPAGKYSSVQQVILSTSNTSAPIYYTTDGSYPSAASSLYIAPIPVTKRTTIRAIALADGYEPSLVDAATYVIVP